MTRALSLDQLMVEAVDAFNARDLEGYLAAMDPDVEAHTLLAELSGSPYVGHGGVRRWWHETLESWDYQTIDLERVESEGDTGVALINLMGRGKTSGVELDMRLAMVFKVRDGLCTYFKIYADRDEAFAAAGLAPHES
jgi:ketosteroid isomerase-like protein